MFAALITLPHFSVSSAMSFPKSADDWASAVAPRSVRRALMLGSARPALISLFSLSMIAVDVFLGTATRGGVFGYGLSKNVANAYEWLIDNYNQGDEIFIFGFSRGAYTARSLAGFIAKCGLLKPGAPLGVNQLYHDIAAEVNPEQFGSSYLIETKAS
jgi:hypothetical protein